MTGSVGEGGAGTPGLPTPGTEGPGASEGSAYNYSVTQTSQETVQTVGEQDVITRMTTTVQTFSFSATPEEWAALQEGRPMPSRPPADTDHQEAAVSFGVTVTTATVDDSESAAAAAASSGASGAQAADGNSWLVPSMIVALTVNMMLMADMLSKMKLVQMEVVLATLGVMIETANNLGDLQLKMAEIKAKEHQMKAFQAGVQMVTSIVGAGMSIGGMGMSMGGAKMRAAAMSVGPLTNSVTGIVNSATTIVVELSLASLAIDEGELKRLEAREQSVQDIAKMMLQQVQEDSKENQQLMDQLLQALARVTEQMRNAFKWSLR